MSKIGALEQLAGIVKRLTTGRGVISNTQRSDLLNYLENEGANPKLVHTHPGSSPVQLVLPKPGELWYRGGDTDLKLKEPIFTTRDKNTAANYATDNGKVTGVGAVGEYHIDAENLANLRDLYLTGLENNIVGRISRDTGSPRHHPFNTGSVLDWVYDKDIQTALAERGHDAAFAREPWGMPSLVALNKDIVTPVRRRIIANEGNEIFKQFPGKRRGSFGNGEAEWDRYRQFGDVTPWSKKAKGGLIQMKECHCG